MQKHLAQIHAVELGMARMTCSCNVPFLELSSERAEAISCFELFEHGGQAAFPRVVGKPEKA